MRDTGRIRETLDRRAQRVLLEPYLDRAIRDELPFHVEIDRAHLVMLVERGLLPRGHARRLFAAIDELIAGKCSALLGARAPRGVYMLYEDWLIDRLGEDVGGRIHLGRSRNDMNATALRLRLRPHYVRVVRELLHLLAVLTRRAERHLTLTMPIYTHHQAALPITYGHYLAGIAVALSRDLQGLQDAVRDLDCCPLGAGAAGGTTVPIDTERTAHLLGFASGVTHSLDAVASRDSVLRLLAAVAILGVTLSRLAADLQLWSTAEFGLLRFDDRLVGSSSMMPQKRNAFLLEHVTGRTGSAIGAFTESAVAMHACPFSNSVAVGTEAVKPIWEALGAAADSVVLARLMVAGAEPQSKRMYDEPPEGFTVATELANRLALETGMSFRQAHRLVGAAVSDAEVHGERPATVSTRLLTGPNISATAASLDPDAVAAGAAFGGGSAPASVRLALAALRRQASAAARALAQRRRRWRAAKRTLDAAIAQWSA